MFSQGCPQSILLEFDEAVRVQEVQIQFQGGFTGKECWIEAEDSQSGDGSLKKMGDFYPEDVNSLQISFNTNDEYNL